VHQAAFDTETKCCRWSRLAHAAWLLFAARSQREQRSSHSGMTICASQGAGRKETYALREDLVTGRSFTV